MGRVLLLLGLAVALAIAVVAGASGGRSPVRIREYPVPGGTHPHDVAPARDGGVWSMAQGSGRLGWLDARSGRTRQYVAFVDDSAYGRWGCGWSHTARRTATTLEEATDYALA